MTTDDALAAARAAAAAAEARGETWQGWTARELEQRRNEAMGFQREPNPSEAERAARNAAENPVPEGWSGAERAADVTVAALLEAGAPRNLMPGDGVYLKHYEALVAERDRIRADLKDSQTAVSGLTIALRRFQARRDEAIAHAKRCEEARYEEQERRKRAEEALAQAHRELADFRAAEEARVKAEKARPAEATRDRTVSERARLIYEGMLRSCGSVGGSAHDLAVRCGGMLVEAEMAAWTSEGARR